MDIETLPEEKTRTTEKEVVIKAEHLKKSFGNLTVLNDINFKLYKKENIAVLGTSGTGKSVLIKSIVGLVKPEEGRLEVFGKDILKKEDEDDWESIRRKVAYLFQGGALYDSMTVKQNLEFPLKRQIVKKSNKELDAEVDEALENVGL